MLCHAMHLVEEVYKKYKMPIAYICGSHDGRECVLTAFEPVSMVTVLTDAGEGSNSVVAISVLVAVRSAIFTFVFV